MATEDEILKTLQRIEKSLKASSPTTAAGTTASRKIGGGADTKQDKVFKATAAAMSSLADEAAGLTKDFNSLSKSVNNVRKTFVQMNVSARAAVRAAPTSRRLSNVQGPPPVAQAQGGFFGGMIPPTSAMGQLLTPRGGPLGRNLHALAGSVSFTSVALTSALAQLGGAVRPLVNDFFRLTARGIDASQSLAGLYVDAAKAGMSLEDYTKVLEDSNPALARAANFDEFAKRIQDTNKQLAGLGIFGANATRLSAAMATSATTLGVPQAQLADATANQVKMFETLRKSTLLTAEGMQQLVADLQSNQEVQSQLLGLSGAERTARYNELRQIQTLGYQLGATAEQSKALSDAIIDQRKLTAPQRFQSAGLIRQAGAITGMDAGNAETLARLSRKKNLSAEEARMATQIGGQLQAQIERMLNSGNIQQEYIAEQLQERLNGAGAGRFLQAAGNVGLTASSGPIANKEFGKGASDLVQGAGMLLSYAKGLSENPILSSIVSALGSGAFSLALGTAIGRFMGRGVPVAGAAAGGGLLQGTKGAISGTVDAVKGGVSKIFDTLSKPFKMGPGTGVFKDIQAGWNALVSSVTNIKGTAGKLGDGLKSAGSFVMNSFNTVGSWFGKAVEGAKGLFTTVKGFTSTGGEIFQIIGNTTKAFGRLLKFIPLIGSLLSGFIDAFGEAFTGNVAAAFNSDGGSWLDRIGNVVFATVNGIFGGIFGLIDSAIKFFGGDGLGLENAWEKFALVMRGGFFSALANIAEAVTFGKENKVSSYFRDAADNSFKVLDQLSADQSATISSIGAQNNKKLDEQAEAAKKSKAAVAETTSAVGTAAGLLTTTKNISGQLVGTAAAVATPAAPVRPTVTPPAVNTATETPAAAPTAALATARDNAPTAAADLTTQLATIISLLQQVLSAEQLQAALAEANARALGRRSFSDTDTMVNKVNSRS